MKRSALKRKTPLGARGKKASAKAKRLKERERAGLGPRFYVDALPAPPEPGRSRSFAAFTVQPDDVAHGMRPGDVVFVERAPFNAGAIAAVEAQINNAREAQSEPTHGSGEARVQFPARAPQQSVLGVDLGNDGHATVVAVTRVANTLHVDQVARFKTGPWRSPEYLAFVRAKPCCVCGKPGPSEAHHWGGKGSRGTGQKCSDAFTAPLCRAHHDQWHLSGTFSGYRWAGEGVAVTAQKLSRADAERIQIEAQRDCLAEWVAR